MPIIAIVRLLDGSLLETGFGLGVFYVERRVVNELVCREDGRMERAMCREIRVLKYVMRERCVLEM